MKVYQKIAMLLKAIHTCKKVEYKEWEAIHEDSLQKIVKKYLPSGAGFDNGIKLLVNKSNSDKLVFRADYHHMNNVGYYDGWTEHTVIVTPSLAYGFDLKITGRDRNYTKDYMYQTFEQWLNEEYKKE